MRGQRPKYDNCLGDNKFPEVERWDWSRDESWQYEVDWTSQYSKLLLWTHAQEPAPQISGHILRILAAPINQIKHLLSLDFESQSKDTKLAGEAGTQPSLRLPPLREGRHAKLLQSAISLRLENGTLRPGDCVLMMDGGREGRMWNQLFRSTSCQMEPQYMKPASMSQSSQTSSCHNNKLSIGVLGLGSSLLSAVKPSATTQLSSKFKSIKHLMWDEKAIRTRKKRSRGSVVTQLERLYVVMAEESNLPYKKRKFYGGTSHGDCIGPIVCPDWEDLWLSVVDKPFFQANLTIVTGFNQPLKRSC